MKKIITYILFCCTTIQLSAQTNDALNHARYWYYKHRVQNDFMRIDVDGANHHGFNIPAGERGFNGAHNTLKGGDGTIELGWYIAALATEYKLLNDNHQPTDITLNNLFGAINTFNRLDYYAETYYHDASGNPGAAILNGFFVRDDIKDATFLGGPTDPLRVGVTSRFIMDTVDFSLSSTIIGNEPRAGGGDQIWYLLMGFKFVKEYIPSGATLGASHPFMDGEIHFVKEVQNIVDRIFDQLQSHDWQIVNPVNGDNIANGDGGDVHAFCFAAATVADQINPDHQHQNLYSANTGLGIWETLGIEGPPLQTPCVPHLQTTDSDKFLLLAELGDTWLPASIAAWAADDDYEYIPLIGQILWHSPNPILESHYEDIFNDAPCDGPYDYFDSPGGTEHYPDNEWSSRSRFVHPETRHDYPCAPALQFEGEYNGLDYMVFHNLYYIQHEATNIVDEAQARVIDSSYPFSPTGGTLANPAVVVGYNWLVSNNEVINTGADVTFHGGYVVHLTNFSSLGGAKFDAYAKPFSCSSTLASYRMADAPADSTTPVNPTTYTAYLQVLNKTEQDKPFVVSPQNANNIDALVQSANKINSSSLLIIPNPSSTGLFHLDFTSTEKSPVKMNVYNTLGVQVTETTLTDEFAELNISDQPKGVYFVKIFTSNGVITKKLVYQ